MPHKREAAIVEQAGGIVLWAGQVVLRRTKAGHFVFPKGHVEPGETREAAAVREVREETGLVAEPVGLAGLLTVKKGGSRRRITVFLMRVVSPTEEWPSHRGQDAFPLPWEWAPRFLTFKNTRKLWQSVRPEIERVAAADAGGCRKLSAVDAAAVA